MGRSGNVLDGGGNGPWGAIGMRRRGVMLRVPLLGFPFYPVSVRRPAVSLQPVRRKTSVSESMPMPGPQKNPPGFAQGPRPSPELRSVSKSVVHSEAHDLVGQSGVHSQVAYDRARGKIR